jgi:RimJ/RimL family protein N-acetyltransferase
MVHVGSPFGVHVDVSIERHGAHEHYRMQSVDSSSRFSAEDVAAVVHICNEPLVWRFLFRDRLGGRRYEERDARDFENWARDGWESGVHLVFLLRGPDGRIGACVDVGRLDESGDALIGYWAGTHHRGVMTNAVECLARLAKKAGYRKLVALVEPENVRSSGVLERAGFSLVGSQEQPVTLLDRPVGMSVRFHRYERAL